MTQKSGPTPDTFRAIFDFFSAPVVDIDCGEMCKHLNGGSPVCCDTSNAIPIVQQAEFKALRARTKMWRRFKPVCGVTQDIVDGLHDDCVAVECRGAKHCERDNRSVSCRTFPFFPYFTNKGEMIGLGYYWPFADRCWVISNLTRVTKAFIEQFRQSYEMLFAEDSEERQVFVDHSASMRRVHSRKKKPFVVIDWDGNFLQVRPHGRGIQKIAGKAVPKFKPFK